MTSTFAVFAFLALAAFGAIGALAGALWMKARGAAALREATEDRTRLLALADHWMWETDAAHRLTTWRPPARRPAGWRVGPPLGATLGADTPNLEQCLCLTKLPGARYFYRHASYRQRRYEPQDRSAGRPGATVTRAATQAGPETPVGRSWRDGR